jgi:hypothetical protein
MVGSHGSQTAQVRQPTDRSAFVKGASLTSTLLFSREMLASISVLGTIKGPKGGIMQAVTWAINSPREARSLARFLLMAGMSWLGLAFLGRVVLFMLNTARQPRLSPFDNLGQAYPTLATWWIPESFLGCLPGFLLIAAGAVVLYGVSVLQRYSR